MNNKHILVGLACICLSLMCQSQTAVDALRFSELLPSGTARMVGVGGAMSSLGGDMGSLTVNPAGLAVYRKSEFNFSPSLQWTRVGSTLNGGSEVDESNTRFVVENAGLVFYKGYKKKKLKAFNFGVTLNRVANFNRSTVYEGTTPGSIVDAFQADAQGAANAELDALTSGVAADAGAIYQGTVDFSGNMDGPTEWSSDFRSFRDLDPNDPGNPFLFNFQSNPIERKETITTTGGISELALTMGFNISHKLYIGIAGSLPLVQFEETRTYEEDDTNTNAIPFFRNLNYEQSITTTGTGIAAKAGFIYRITNKIRLGGSIHTPTRFSLNDRSFTTLNYFFIEGENTTMQELIDGEGLSDIGEFDFILKTPWRFNGGASLVLKKFGFISLDIEYFDYGNQEYNFTTNNNTQFIRNIENATNSEIDNLFANTLNIRIGAEYLIKKIRLRAGYGRYGSPFDEGADDRNIISLGAGIRGERVFLDMAYRNTSSTETFSPYTSPNEFSQNVSSNIGTNNLILTFGYRF